MQPMLVRVVEPDGGILVKSVRIRWVKKHEIPRFGVVQNIAKIALADFGGSQSGTGPKQVALVEINSFPLSPGDIQLAIAVDAVKAVEPRLVKVNHSGCDLVFWHTCAIHITQLIKLFCTMAGNMSV
ncbi:MAG: hypothetical protein WCG36_08705, partial [bacterium]